jgi:alpha-glucosidase
MRVEVEEMRYIKTERLLFPSHVQRVERSQTGALIHLDDEMLRVDVIRPDILRLKISRGKTFDEQPTFACCFDMPAKEEFELEETDEQVIVRTSRLELRVRREPFAFAVYRPDGSVIFESATEKEQTVGYGTDNDRFVLQRKYRPDDAIFGLGEKTHRLNRKGRNFIMYNNDLPHHQASEIRALPEGDPRKDVSSTKYDPYYISIPFFYRMDGSRQDYPVAGFFLDNGYKVHYEFEDQTTYRVQALGGQYTEYVMAGPSMKQVLEAYTFLTGRMSVPPIWALGFHQCRWNRYSQENLLNLAKKMREHEFPCDVMWLDIDYMDGYRVFTWDKELFPDVPKMLEQFREQGFRAITIIDPGVKYEKGNELFEDGKKRNVFCKTESGALFTGYVWPGRTVFPDFVKPEARKWWGELNANHVKSGLAGIWNDMNEPSVSTEVAEADMRFDRDGKNWPHDRYHNQYALLMAMGTAEGLRAALPEERSFVLSRAGFAGIQRYAANWLGDNFARWDHLWMSMPMSMGMSVSGQPFVGADVGGFAEYCSDELFARWMQYAALTPFFRNHMACGSADRYPWSYGRAIAEIVRDAVKLRYRLLPYLYSAFVHTSETGEPVMRPLVYEFQHDRSARDIDDEYLLGNALLVAPIYREGETRRRVYLPQGSWTDWWTGEMLKGQRFITAEAPLDRIPMFARGGSVIPMLTEAPQTTMRYQTEMVELKVVVPAGDGEWTSTLQEDDGTSTGYRNGAYLRTTFTVTRQGGKVSVTAGSSGKGFNSFARRRFRISLLGARAAMAKVDGREALWPTDGLILPNAGEAFRLEFSL